MPSNAQPGQPAVTTYRHAHKDEVIGLILHIQNAESGVGIALEDQPDLRDIPRNYSDTGGGFWVALDGTAHVVGTIGLQIKTPQVAVLKKFFVSAAWRGAGMGCASRLFDELMSHAGRNGITTIVLDTPSVSVRSHQFYKRQGFVQVTAADLPVRYDFPDRNSLFFRLDLAPL